MKCLLWIPGNKIIEFYNYQDFLDNWDIDTFNEYYYIDLDKFIKDRITNSRCRFSDYKSFLLEYIIDTTILSNSYFYERNFDLDRNQLNLSIEEFEIIER